MVLTNFLRNEAGKRNSLFLVLTITVLVTFVIIPSYSIQKAHAAEITLAWDQNSEPDIAGYRIYYGQESRSYTNVVDVGNYTSCVIADLEDGETYYFAATAYNTEGYESGYSNEISNGEPTTAPYQPPDDNDDPVTTPDQPPDDDDEPVAIPDQPPDDDGDGNAASGGSGGGGSSCFINTAACGFPAAQLKDRTKCGLSEIKRVVQYIVCNDWL
jgi:hypothetical protein